MDNNSVGCVDGNGSSVKVIKGYRLNQNKKGGMNQGRKNSSYESSARIAFWSMVATIVLVMLLLLCPKIAEPQNVEWLKPDISSQEHLLAGTMISYTSGYLLEQGFNMRYGYELGLIAGGLAGYLKERSDPVFDMTDLSFTIAGSIAGLYINKGIQKWYGLSDYEKVLKKINRLEKQAEKMRNNGNTRTNIAKDYNHRRKMGDGKGE